MGYSKDNNEICGDEHKNILEDFGIIIIKIRFE